MAMTITFTCWGNSAPAYSCNLPGDQSGEYVSLEQYNALMAQTHRLRQELEYFIQRDEEGSIRSRVTYERFQRALASTPAARLAEVRAKAVLSFADSVQRDSIHAPTLKALAKHHAEKLLKEIP